ncbi:MAG: L-seryl-tRNA(Sec) selenium transferase [Chloroflexota bacterium]|nr:L-seryl-tRNA(Sec) selenium transferase [Chloroflexota bacterium]
MADEPRRSLPSVDRVISDARLDGRAGSDLVVRIARDVLGGLRARIPAGEPLPAFDSIVDDVARALDAALESPLRPLINATGVILHTNLGRAPLAQEAIDAMAAVTRGYSNLEFDINEGKRGSRHSLLEPLLCRLTGAEAAMAVNNNAAAVLLALSAVGAGREVVISRGQLVEIGGGFRIPDVMRQSRAKLVEAGTTNRTRIEDFDQAVGPKAAALMRVHPSNFRIVGFTESPSIDELASVAGARGVLLIDDIGSGCLLDTTVYGLPPEPTPQASIAAGADLVLFSGDKLLGGPQGGLIVGRQDLLRKLKRHPLARTVRMDKASIAGLAATLRLYLEGAAEEKIPVWRMIGMPLDAITTRADTMVAEIGDEASTMEGRSMIGGGSLPGESLPTRLVSLRCRSGADATSLAARLRTHGVVARIEDGRVLLDPRTVAVADDGALARACVEALD